MTVVSYTVPCHKRSNDLLATLPVAAMLDTAQPYRLDSRHVPFSIDPLPHAMLWNTARGNDPETSWLRARLSPIVKSRFAGTARSHG